MGGNIIHVVRTILAFGEHLVELFCLVTPLTKFDIILGMPWLELHDPQISFGQRSCTFNSDHCISNCLQHHKSVTVYSGNVKKPRPFATSQLRDIAEISVYAFMKMAERKDNQVIAMWPEDFERLDQSKGNDSPEFTVDVVAISSEDYAKFF